TRPSGLRSADGRGVGRPPATSGQTGMSRTDVPRASTPGCGLPSPRWLQATPRRQADTRRAGRSAGSGLSRFTDSNLSRQLDVVLRSVMLSGATPASLLGQHLAVEEELSTPYP